MSLKAFFVSDLHLGPMDEPRAQTFLRWLKTFKSLEDITHLFMLGDIFDLWIAHHQYFIDTYRPIIDEVKRLKSLGVEISFFEGNHDLYLNHFWGKEVGIRVVPDPIYVKLGPWVLRLEHGDQMDPTDKGYRFLRWFLRTPFMKFVAPNFPSSFIVRLGEKASEKSRHYTSNIKSISSNGASRVMESHAHKAYQETPFDFLICGHTHFREIQSYPHFKAINLGSWFDEPQVGLLTTDSFQFLSP